MGPIWVSPYGTHILANMGPIWDPYTLLSGMFILTLVVGLLDGCGDVEINRRGFFVCLFGRAAAPDVSSGGLIIRVGDVWMAAAGFLLLSVTNLWS